MGEVGWVDTREVEKGEGKEISYRDREEEDKDDSWPGTPCIWQGRLVEP